jgi:threonine dehydrogenase-like Zn-dependent dehydrogenase
MQGLAIVDGSVSWVERPMPEPLPGEALVRVAMAGICNTDIEIARGYMGFAGVLGHELCGVVERCADPRWIGRRVAGEINLGCMHCDMCERKLDRHCPTRTVLGIVGKDGCFAPYVTLPIANLHRLPDSLSDELACFVEPTAAAFEIVEQVQVRSRDKVAVIGDGKLGLLIAQVPASTGAPVTVIGKHEGKLEIARAAGAQTVRASGDALNGSTLAEGLERKSFDTVVEATGSPIGMKHAIELTRPRGTIVLKSTYHGPLTLDVAPLVIDELQIVGSRCGPFEPAIAALATGAVDPRPMISEIIPFERGVEAFARASTASVLKVLLDMRAGHP